MFTSLMRDAANGDSVKDSSVPGDAVPPPPATLKSFFSSSGLRPEQRFAST